MAATRILGIGTAIPAHTYSHAYARDRMLSWIPSKPRQRLIRIIYSSSGIETRHSVLGDFETGATQTLFRTDEAGNLSEPGTRERNDRFIVESRKLAFNAAEAALRQMPGLSSADVTHVIGVTCTGFANPGIDYYLVRDLGLRKSTARFMLGFMGCYAAVPGLRLASDICRADPKAVVLVVSVELCSLHLRLGSSVDSITSNAIFSDGAAAAVVSAREPAENGRAFGIESFASSIIPEGEKDMAWSIGDKGFEIALSTYVPDIIGANIRSMVEPVLAASGLGVDDIDLWAVHPGGKAIVDKVEKALELRPAQLASSRRTLLNHGNMSSATILFLLKDILENVEIDRKSSRVLALAFGPGLTVESTLLTIA